MNVLSLFDGMSCGRIALERAGVEITNYFACEIDKYAIQVSKHNYDDIYHLGDVTKLEVLCLPKIDLIIGGSPCQGFSFAGKQLNFNDPRSKLFFEFVRLLNDVKAYNPKVLFFLENVQMKKEYQNIISEHLGVQPILINSALVSAQNRKRLYWTNLPYFGLPEDRNIFLKDILEDIVNLNYKLSPEGLRRGLHKKYSTPKFDPDKTGTLNTKNNSGQLSIDSGTTFVSVEQDEKSLTLCAGYRFNPSVKEYEVKRIKQLIRTSEGVTKNKNKNKIESRNDKSMCLDANYYKGFDNHGQRTLIKVGLTDNTNQQEQNRRVYSEEGLSPTLSTNPHCVPKIGTKLIGLADDRRGHDINRRVYSDEGKSPTLLSKSSPGGHETPKIYQRARGFNKGNIFEDKTPPITSNSWQENNKLINGSGYRKLTPVECERLQTIPDNYTSCVSNTQRHKMLGNGWNVETIVHFFKWLKIIGEL